MRRSAFEPCIPTKATKLPDRPEWISATNLRPTTVLAPTYPRVKLRPHLGAALAAACAGKARFDVREPDIISPTVSIGLDAVRTAVIATIDQDIAHAAGAHLAEGDFVGRAVIARSAI
jgi:hypothetical protein